MPVSKCIMGGMRVDADMGVALVGQGNLLLYARSCSFDPRCDPAMIAITYVTDDEVFLGR